MRLTRDDQPAFLLIKYGLSRYEWYALQWHSNDKIDLTRRPHHYLPFYSVLICVDQDLSIIPVNIAAR